MASACVNNIPTTTTTSYTSYGWLSPRVSLSHDFNDNEEISSSPKPPDFEFCLGGTNNNNNKNNDTMISADQIFSDGKLVPLHFSSAPKTTTPPPSTPPEKVSCKSIISEDPYLFSPKAPRCSSRWKDLFGLKKLNLQTKTSLNTTTTSNTTSTTSSSKSMVLFLNKNYKTASSTSVNSSLSLPLLKDSSSSSSDFESFSLSSSNDHLENLPRASLDAEKPKSGPKVRTRPKMSPNIRKDNSKIRGISSVDSPRMNPSGKVVFQSLERSSSSPSSFNGGPRYNNINNNNKHHNNRGVMERSYSGNVHIRITPVLNVPVCSLRSSSKSGVFGFGNLFSSSSKKESSINGSTKAHHHHRNKKEEKEKEKEKEKESC